MRLVLIEGDFVPKEVDGVLVAEVGILLELSTVCTTCDERTGDERTGKR